MTTPADPRNEKTTAPAQIRALKQDFTSAAPPGKARSVLRAFAYLYFFFIKGGASGSRALSRQGLGDSTGWRCVTRVIC